MNSISSPFEPTPPFRLDLTIWALRRRPHNQIDLWDGRTYRRVLALAGQPVAATVVQTGPSDAPQLQVTVTGETVTVEAAPAVAQTLARTLDIGRDLTDFHALAAYDPQLGPLVKRFRGLKPPRFPTLFGCLVNAISCQQLTLTLGLRLLNRLAETHGPAVAAADGPLFGLPQPEALAAVDLEALRALQFSRQKARALTELAAAVAGENWTWKGWPARPMRSCASGCAGLWGVGRWTAEYALLRGLGRLLRSGWAPG